MQVATLENGNAVNVTGKGITLLVALIAIVPATVTAGVDYLIKPQAQEDTFRLETARIDFEKQKARTALLQAALADPDPAQRHLLITFLAATGALDDDEGVIAGMSADKIPYWRSSND